MAASGGALPDLQSLWETAQREIALEGCNGCTLERLWRLVSLGKPLSPTDSSRSPRETALLYGGSGLAAETKSDALVGEDRDPGGYLKDWLWRWAIWNVNKCSWGFGRELGCPALQTVRRQIFEHGESHAYMRWAVQPRDT